MLSTSIAHFTHETAEAVGLGNLGPDWISQRASLHVIGQKFKKAALANILLAESSETSPDHGKS
jgi:hypothetical protein